MSSNKAKCRDCGEDIVWLKTKSGKNIAVEPESLPDTGATVFEKSTMACHWDLCPSRVKEEAPKQSTEEWPDARKPQGDDECPF